MKINLFPYFSSLNPVNALCEFFLIFLLAQICVSLCHVISHSNPLLRKTLFSHFVKFKFVSPTFLTGYEIACTLHICDNLFGTKIKTD